MYAFDNETKLVINYLYTK